jgi:hypothetical protein
LNSGSNIEALKILHDGPRYTAISIESVNGHVSLFILSNADAETSNRHELKLGEREYSWSGPFFFGDLEQPNP